MQWGHTRRVDRIPVPNDSRKLNTLRKRRIQLRTRDVLNLGLTPGVGDREEGGGVSPTSREYFERNNKGVVGEETSFHELASGKAGI